MAAQGLALDGSRISALIWRGLLLLRAIGIGVAAGFVAGLIAAGIGSRLVMKVVALTAGPSAEGRITENGNTIGAFTIETRFLLLTGAAIGIVGGLLYVALRPWLTGTGRWRGLACGMVLLATGGALVFDGGNFDFTRFGHPALNLALFAALYLGFGLIVAPLADWLDRRLPAPRSSQPGTTGAARRLGIVAFATIGGLFGCLALILFAALTLGPAGNERAEARLVGILVLLLIAGSLVGRVWPGHPARERVALALAVPMLAGLGATLRELATILLGG